MSVPERPTPPPDDVDEAPADPPPSAWPQWLKIVPVPRRHWTPRYVLDRVQLALYQRRHPQHPWLTRAMIEWLEPRLQPEHTLVEFGSGRSTLWFAKRVGRVASCEHHRAWHAEVSRQLREAGLTNVNYLHVPEDPGGYVASAGLALQEIGERLADVILVDGIYRDHCAVWALDHIRAGGLIIVDNVNWFLPSRSRAPRSIPEGAPAKTSRWRRFAAVVAGWDCVWTSDGVTDTAAFRAPPGQP